MQILKKQGAEIIDADEITRELQKKGSVYTTRWFVSLEMTW